MILRGVVAGAILLVLGAALFLVPISGQGITSFADTSGAAPVAGPNESATFYEPAITPAAISFSVSWAYSGPVNVSVYSCGTDTGCAAATQYRTPSDLVAQGTSAVGTLTFNGVAGNGYEVYASSVISLTLTYNGPLVGGVVGLLFLIIGAIVLIAGAAVPAGGLRPPTAVKDSILRQPGEVFRWYWEGSWDGSAGGLLLSSQRLVLLNRSAGSGGSQFSARESIALNELSAVEIAVSSYGAGQLILKTAGASPRTFAIVGKFTPARAARAIQRSRAVQTAGTKKGAMASGGEKSKAGEVAAAPGAASNTGSPQVVYREKETIREVVKIPCRYCGTLNDQLNTKCSGCGAAMGRG